MIQEKEDAAAWLSTLHGEELTHIAAVFDEKLKDS